MTKEEFEQNYCGRSKITMETYKLNFVTLPCACSYEECQGWAAVENESGAIRVHTELYSLQPPVSRDKTKS